MNINNIKNLTDIRYTIKSLNIILYDEDVEIKQLISHLDSKFNKAKINYVFSYLKRYPFNFLDSLKLGLTKSS